MTDILYKTLINKNQTKLNICNQKKNWRTVEIKAKRFKRCDVPEVDIVNLRDE